eukprot:115341_1
MLYSILVLSSLVGACYADYAYHSYDSHKTPFYPFSLTCKDNSDCPTYLDCDTSGPRPHDVEGVFYCKEPEYCDAYAPQSFNGICNNLRPGKRFFGAAGALQPRLVPGPNPDVSAEEPRRISDKIVAQLQSIPNVFGGSALMIHFGQFVDHDLTLIVENEDEETILLQGSPPVSDFDFTTSERLGETNPSFRNEPTSFLDLSQVYGSDEDTASKLRSFVGGQLRSEFVDGIELLPRNSQLPDPVPLGNPMSDGQFAAGDVRVNEQIMLTAIQTLFLREHNRLARYFMKARDLHWEHGDEWAFQQARRWNIAQFQNIVLNEYFPFIHREPLSAYRGYNDSVDPGVFLLFSTASYRFGHSGIPDELLRVGENGEESTISLAEAFANPGEATRDNGIDAFLKGSVHQCHERLDHKVVDGLRNLLFGNVDEFSLDLAMLNIARSRDHQLASFNDYREFFGHERFENFLQLVGGDKQCLADDLESVYPEGIDQGDPWVLGLCEMPTRGQMGELFFQAQKEMFERVRDGDRFYFENVHHGPGFTPKEIYRIHDTSFHDILRRNTFLNGKRHSPNFVKNVFQSKSCCFYRGVVDSNKVCLLGTDGAELKDLPPCDVEAGLKDGSVVYPGTKDVNTDVEYDCECQTHDFREEL